MSDSNNRKQKPVFSGLLQYFPDALMEVANHSKRGNDKHNPGEPLRWDRGKSTDQADCLARHLIDIGPNWDKIDEETGSLHAAALAWRALALLQLVLEKSKAKSQTSQVIDAVSEDIKAIKERENLRDLWGNVKVTVDKKIRFAV